VKRWFQEGKNKKQRVRTEADIRAKITTNSGTLAEIASYDDNYFKTVSK
jgi:hypothetical protein